MFKTHSLYISLILLLSGAQTVFAQDQTTTVTTTVAAPPVSSPPPPPISSPPPSPIANANPLPMPTNGNETQFQNWLKGNASVATPPPAPLGAKVIRRSAQPRRTRVYNVPDCSDSPVISPPISYNQSQRIMLKSAPPAPPANPESQAAFNIMMQKNMPLSPQQVVKLRQLIDRSQRAASIPANIPPKPVSTTLMMNLAPGTTPPAIRIAPGYVSSLVFVDSTGSPWPIASYDIGDPKAVNIQWDGKSNIMLVQSVAAYTDGNVVIRLTGLPTPITLELVSGQRVVDFRVDLHVPGLGPNSKDLPTGVNLPDSASQLLLSVLDGVAPGGSKPLTVTGGECQAWLLGDQMYLRTRLTVLSPGWIGKMVSPDGMNAYEMQKTSSVLVSQYGQPIELKVEGF